MQKKERKSPALRAKMRMIKRALSIFLCVILLVGCVQTGFVDASAASTASVITSLAKKFPNGKYWNHIGSKKNNPDGYTSTACNHHKTKGCSITPGGCECNSFLDAIQCMGFAYKSAYDLVGSNPREWKKSTKLNLSALCVGDIIRYLNDVHSITVVGVSGDTVAYVGANWGANCLIKWGTIKKSDIKGFSYVLHDEKNTRKNTDLNIYNKPASPEPEQTVTGETWKTRADAALNIRGSAVVTSAAVGIIPAGKSFTVTKKVNAGDYLWGYVYYKGVRGWSALDYAKYVKGSYDAPDIKTGLSDITAGKSFTLSFSAVNGAQSYRVDFYGADSRLYLSETVKGTSDSFVIRDAGKYTVKVTAQNSHSPSWGITGKAVSFQVSDKVTVSDGTQKGTESWRVSADAAVQVKRTAAVSSSVAGSIPAGADFSVTEKKISDGIFWGYVKYGELKGWAALNDLQYVSGAYEKPDVKEISSLVREDTEFTLDFSPVSGADSYEVLFFDSENKLSLAQTTASACAKFILNEAGSYTVKVTASNSKTPSWKVQGAPYAFYVGDGSVTAEKITLPSEVRIANGSEYTLKPTLIPGEAKDELIWESSDPAVASVSAQGKITGVGYGQARITCKSAKNALAKTFTDVTVSTAAVKNIRQSGEKTTSTAAVISWDKVPDAAGYQVYYNDSKLTLIGKTKATSMKISGLKGNTSRNIVVCSYVTVGGKDYMSDVSKAFTVTTGPAAVTSVRVTDIKEKSAVLRWRKAAGADYYEVYKYVKGKGYVRIGTTKKNDYKIKGKTPTVYKLKVKAVNKVSGMKLSSPLSDSASLVFRPAQTTLRASAAKNAVTLSWKKVKGASGYEVYMYTAGGYKKIKTLSASSSSYKKTKLKSNTSYTFKVRAYTKAGTTTAYAVSAKVRIKTL